MTPAEASLAKNSKAVNNSLFPNKIILGNREGNNAEKEAKYRVGDRVRISKNRKDFTNFREEIFVILKVLETDPPTYILNYIDGEIIARL